MSKLPFVAVIMAGGQGQRFWPLSTPERPKQFLDLQRTGRTLIQSTYDRVVGLAGDSNHVLVATAARYVPLVREQLPDVPRRNVLVEPMSRDSAPAIALANLLIERRFGDVVAGFFSSDHLIGPGQGFGDVIRSAAETAQAENGLVTVGIKPTRPATGYGYIQTGKPVGNGHKVARFVEKPNLHIAETYLDSGDYLWNAGIFVWRVSAALAELDEYVPELMGPLRQAVQEDRVEEVFPTLQRISIDYALMEHTTRAYVVPAAFQWDDIGDWVALERHMQHEDLGHGANTVVGRHIGLDTSGNIVYTEDPEDVIVTLGVHDLVIVKRGHAILLVHKSRVEEIKTLLADERMGGLF